MADRDVSLPRYADVVIVGGGTAGAVVAGRLAEQTDRSVLLLEAGPDYGSFSGGGWPRPLVDARALPALDHDWRYVSAARLGTPGLPLERARVLGGCSSHNGCAAVWGSRLDYDGWERRGNPGWGAEALLPLFHAVSARLRVRTPRVDELTPWQRACLDAAPGAGIPVVDDLNNLDENVGAAATPVNVSDGVRWNTAFAYLDPVRDRASLTIRGNVLADRLVMKAGRAHAVEVIGPAGLQRIEAGHIVVCAGAYGSPALLLRSGIGVPDELRPRGIAPAHELPGVGQNLHDHPAVVVTYAASPRLVAEMERFARGGGWLPEEQTIAKARSSRCREAFDLHLYPVGGPYASGDGRWTFTIPVANLVPASRGTLRLAGRDPDLAPVIDHGYLTDTDESDIAVLLDGVELVRNLAAQAPLAGLIVEEIAPGPGIKRHDPLSTYIRGNSAHYYHPAGTCAMGPSNDTQAVVDARGAVYGLEGLSIADASIMPVVPRANTNIPCAVIGEKIAALLMEQLN